MPWIYLHRHKSDSEDAKDHYPETPLIIETETCLVFMPRLLNRQPNGCWMRRPNDDGRGGLWVAESFEAICDRLDVRMPSQERGKWDT